MPGHRHPYALPLTLAILLGGLLPSASARSAEITMQDSQTKVTVIAHRGASALLPEHTLAAYAKAIEDGADAIEPDLVSTADGVLVARHENEIGSTTNVATHPQFAARKTSKHIDGEPVEGWFTEDFTLAELRTLRARERLPQLRPTEADGRFPIATLDEIIDLVATESAKRGRVIGLVPEIKHPTYFTGIGLPMDEKLLSALAAHAYTQQAPVTIQSFETGNLRQLRGRIGESNPNLRLLQLLGGKKERPYDLVAAKQRTTYDDMMTPAGLREIATYADAIGPSISSVELTTTKDGGTHSTLVQDAHAAGLQVVLYTFRPENYFLPREFRNGDAVTACNTAGSIRHMRAYIDAGIDALFADDPATGRQAVDGEPER